MLLFLKDWIINIVTITVILILFEIIIPTGKIKKIINLVSGFILLIVIINPFIALRNQNYTLREDIISDSFYIDKKELENSSKLLNDTQMKQIAGIYKKKLINKIQAETEEIEGVVALKVDVQINEDYNSDSFGEVNRVYLEMQKNKKQDKDEKTADSIKIKPVSVVNVEINSQSENAKTKASNQINENNSKIAEQVKDNLNRALEINKDLIFVTILEE
ncbi:stage III sporulation protein AF [Ruminiclostridium herbifermentans]|uniref:Stage III sporulation protein AF n=1 Tax=Ruminiclostridium herbifermentans TaxID=2488810 RepID=A0A4U7JMA2_9FIRM|nr:stage III sporulation protein AF [Ruminiclostridium herbifermentans]QNU65515.1 stage III sporulation protein AF [Ruminiclostridium herbifermentans]